VLFAHAAMGAWLVAFLFRTGFVTRLRHFTSFPQSVVLSAVAFANYLAITVIRLTSRFLCHYFSIPLVLRIQLLVRG
jgi:hypothetical protein